jgi:nitrite reductase (NO-forming)
VPADVVPVPPRVKTVHAQARRALGLATGFALAAAAAVVVPHRTGAWLPLHLFLVGALLLAISGATRLFTVTWSAGQPRTGAVVTAQRWLVAGGAAGLAAGRELGWPVPIVAAAGSAVTAGLALLAYLLAVEVRTAKVRRFHPATTYYLVAIGFGIAGTVLGAAMVTGGSGLRDAHVAVNLLGLVGLVIAGTLPFFVATHARMKMSRRATPERLRANLAWLSSATLVAALAAGAGDGVVEAVALVAYAAGLLHLVTLLPRPGRKQLAWAGPRLLQLAAGILWWTGALVVASARAGTGQVAFAEPVVIALVIGGYAQILVASLAYLAPVLRGGGHERLASGFATTRSWTALAAANLAALAWVTGQHTVTGVALVMLAADVAQRAVRLRVRAASAPRSVVHV